MTEFVYVELGESRGTWLNVAAIESIKDGPGTLVKLRTVSGVEFTLSGNTASAFLSYLRDPGNGRKITIG